MPNLFASIIRNRISSTIIPSGAVHVLKNVNIHASKIIIPMRMYIKRSSRRASLSFARASWREAI
jgi:hypothetical protein